MSSSDRVAVFVPSLRGGGAERVMLHIAIGLADVGYSTDIVLATAEGPYLREVPKHVRLVDLGSRRVSAALPGLVRYIKTNRPKALISALTHANVVALCANRLCGSSSRVIVTEHGLRPVLSRRSRFAAMLAHWFYPQAYRVVTVSHGLADDVARIMGIPRDRITVIYNPVVTPNLYAMAEQEPDHPWLVSKECPVIVGAGRLQQQKDFGTLIRAIDLVRRTNPVRLVILGEGTERGKLEKLIKDLGVQSFVSMPGFVSNPYAYMKRADLFALSSAWEGFGNVLVEAMAVGTPVVSTDCRSGPSEILENGTYGELVPVGDAAALARAINRALSTPVDRELLRRRAEEFTFSEIVSHYSDLIEQE